MRAAMNCARRVRGAGLARHLLTPLALRRSPAAPPCRWLANKATGEPSAAAKAAVVTTLDVLRLTAKGQTPQFVSENDVLWSVMQRMVEDGVGSLIVRDTQDRVVGFITQRDVLRCIVRIGVKHEYSGEPMGWNVPVSQAMTPSKDLLFLSPTDTLEDARSLMAISGKRHIPVLSGSTLLGILHPKDIARYIYLVSERSAKTEYVTNVMPRRGMPLGTKLKLEGPGGVMGNVKVQLHSAVCVLPHPNKVATGGEDAYLLGPFMIGVSDGVGTHAGVKNGNTNAATHARHSGVRGGVV